MIECPICGLSERCHNHWVAVQEPNGEVEFQIGAMTASEDNLILLRNKLKNPPLRALFAKIELEPQWVEEQGRVLAYLPWPLELRGAVHRTLFPAGTGNNSPLPPTIFHTHQLEDLQLEGVELDTVNCLPDELLYKARFQITLSAVGRVPFDYMQILFAPGVEWAPPKSSELAPAQDLVRLVLGGLVDPLRSIFAGHEVQVLSEDQPESLMAGKPVDEIALPGEPERHLGEEIEKLINERRLQPLLRDQLLRFLGAGTVESLQ
ncbi:MAG: hypothetical protein ACRD0Y_01800 [Terriglobales bacterium]